MSMKNSKFSKQ